MENLLCKQTFTFLWNCLEIASRNSESLSYDLELHFHMLNAFRIETEVNGLELWRWRCNHRSTADGFIYNIIHSLNHISVIEYEKPSTINWPLRRASTLLAFIQKVWDGTGDVKRTFWSSGWNGGPWRMGE